ncbi:MAG: DnaJ domain-containing protein [Anaerolineales bacterium]
MPNQKDYYLVLGLPRNATPEEIRKAYFEAARRLHPDTNTAPGETEFFLDVQEAYEVLSDAKKRAQYDASLPPEKTADTPVRESILFSRKSLTRLDEPQLIYVLLEYAAAADARSPAAPPLNLCLVLDRSTSMQGLNMDMVKATAIQILRRMRPQDIFSVVAFSDRAETIVPSTRNADLAKLEARIQMLQTAGATEIFQGLQAGYTEIQKHLKRSNVNHIILLTDGRTYGDEEQCLQLAAEAAKKGIGISGLGIGHEWNDALLDELAVRTGGSSMYVSRPQDIQRLLIEKFNLLWQVFADEVRFDFRLPPGVHLRYAFRLQPEAGLLALDSPILMGPILRDHSLKVLMEFLIEPTAVQAEPAVILEGSLDVSIAALAAPLSPLPLRLSRPVAAESNPEPPPQEIVDALSKLTLYRMQEQARLEVSAGEHDKAVQHLHQLATHLLARGERGLARTVLLEAEHIQRNKAFSQEGDKQIKYGTRALLLSGLEKEKHDSVSELPA